ncbi:hypothetical protein OFAG_02352 [Oxalobacter formigenes HOxBLS]|uniref:Uncharacterized protein n=1 Tax=Oxalobacter paraformigenes TaxID=556268 RepID=T5LUG2_9BURK|nr:hypothetical protein OFAG_02352 [Oxalobacter paraformigenes]
MNSLSRLENEKQILVNNLKLTRISWKMDFIKDELAYKQYEDYMGRFFPRSIFFRLITRHPSFFVLPFSFLMLKKSFFFLNLIRKLF